MVVKQTSELPNCGSAMALTRFTPPPSCRIWQPQMEGGRAARELPRMVDQVMALGLFSWLDPRCGR